MKKILALLLCLLMVLSLAFSMTACGAKDKDDDDDKDKASASESKDDDEKVETKKTPAELVVGEWKTTFGEEELGVNTDDLLGALAGEIEIPEFTLDLIFKFSDNGDFEMYYDKDAFENLIDEYKEAFKDYVKKNAEDNITDDEINETFDEAFNTDDLSSVFDMKMEGKYEIEGNKMILDVDGEKEEGEFEVSATDFKLTLDGETMEFTRK